MPTAYDNLPALQQHIADNIYQNSGSVITGAVHQEVEQTEAASLWREPTATAPLQLTGTIQAQNVKLIEGTASGNVYQWNATLGSWQQVQTKTSKIIWVDGTYGVDATAQAYNPFRPFQTLIAAQTAAVSGDLIHVRPGSYTPVSILGKNGVNWYFDAGATVTGNIGDGGVGMTFSIYGQGVFTYDSGNTVSQSNASSNITIYAKSITATSNAGSPNAVICSGGSQTVYANVSSTGTQGYGAGCSSSGIQIVYGDVNGNYIGASCSSGTQTIFGNVTSSTLRAISNNTGTQIIHGNVTGPTAVAAAVATYIRIDGLITGVIDMNTGGATGVLEIQYKAIIPNAIIIAAGATLILCGGARLVSSGGTYCATGAGTIISYGAYATLASSGVTVSGTLNVGAYVQ